jgi:hypothetical protein
VGGEAQLVDALQQDVGVEDAEDRLLAERGRHRAHPKLDLAAALVPLDPAVLGPTLLREVRSGEELDAGDDRLVDDLRDDVDVVEDAVDPQPHQGEVALGLEVDVGGALLEGVAEDVVEGLDHGGGGGVEVGGGLGEELLVPEVDGRDAALGELLLGVLEARLEVVEALVHRLDVGAGRDHQVDVELRDALDLVDPARGRERVVHRDRDALGVLVDVDRHDAVASGERTGDRLGHDVEIEVERVDLDVGQARVRGEGLCDLRVARDAELYHRLLGGEVVHLLGAAHLVRLLGGQELLRHEHGEKLRRLGRRHGCDLLRRWNRHERCEDYRSRSRGRQLGAKRPTQLSRVECRVEGVLP